jgi:hypothetical protein
MCDRYTEKYICSRGNYHPSLRIAVLLIGEKSVKGPQKEHRDFQSALQRLSMPVTTVIVREGPLQRRVSNPLARAVRFGRMMVDSMEFRRFSFSLITYGGLI